MFDVQSDMFDQKRVSARLSNMSDEDLAALEDDLDFCNFTGMPTVRVLEFLKDFTDLDNGWQRMLEKRTVPDVPQPF